MFVRATMTLTAMGWTGPAGADVLTVTTRGTIQPTCSVAASQQFSTSNLNIAGSTVAKATVTCNQFFKVNATSAKGAIKSDGVVAAPFTNSVAYSLKADDALDDSSTRSATCSSASLVAGQSSCALSPANSTGLTSNGQISTGKATTLTVSWTPPSLPTLLKPGSYSDVINLTIAAVP
jgi:hypothetical protein